MFSEIQRNFIQQMVLSNRDEYPYYLAVTNSNINQGGSGDAISFYLYLSDEPITAQSQYSYVFSGNCIRYAVRSGNSSFNYHGERVGVSAGPSSLIIDNYEFCYTNAEFSSYATQPDLLATDRVVQSHFDGFSIAILVILVAVIFSKIMRGGGSYAKI